MPYYKRAVTGCRRWEGHTIMMWHVSITADAPEYLSLCGETEKERLTGVGAKAQKVQSIE